MSRFGFLARKSGSEEKPVEPAGASENPLELDEELFSTAGSLLGGENEALRYLLLDANNKIGELDTIKAAVGKLVDPVSKALREFEAEKTEKVGLQTVLNNTRAAYGKLCNEVGDLEKKLVASDRECQSLRQDLAATQSLLHTLETTKTDCSIDIAAARANLGIGSQPGRSGPGNASPCAMKTAASTSGWSPPKNARSPSNRTSAPRVSGCWSPKTKSARSRPSSTTPARKARVWRAS